MYYCCYYVIFALFALAIGSFLNVVIYRLPQIILHECKRECAILLKRPVPKLQALNLWWPRSFCPKCHHTLSVLSNIPLLSYLLQRGKCRHCHKAISLQYPLVELVTLVLSLYALHLFGFTLPLVFALVFIWCLIVLFVIDCRTHLLPDSLTLGLLWLGLLANMHHGFTSLPDAVLGAVVGYLVLWILVRVFYLTTGRVGMGGGDLKLFAALGAWFGWVLMPLMLFFASIVGVITGLLYLKISKQSKNTPIPFGPFLCLTGLFVLFYGNIILAWYLQ